MTERDQDINDMLTYVSTHQIVVCTKCKYAIQPSALSSHLLRHGIYRKDRQRLLARFTSLPLLAPELVPLPKQITEPCKELPIYKGRRCLEPSCTYLCLSEKRMSQHWAEDHRSSDVRTREAKMQTFFRGNKLKYFEVDRNEAGASATHVSTISKESWAYKQHRNSFETEKPIGTQPPTTPINNLANPLEKENLQLMHNYTASAYYAMCVSPGDEDFWRSEIPQEAFKHDFLLRGLLSFSAIHLAFLAHKSQNMDLMLQCIRVAALHQSIGIPLFRTALATPTTASSTALAAFSRITGSMRTCEARLEWLTSTGTRLAGQGDASALVEFLMLCKGTYETMLDMQKYLHNDSQFLLPKSVEKEWNDARYFNTKAGKKAANSKVGSERELMERCTNVLGATFEPLMKSSSPNARRFLLVACQNLLRSLNVHEGASDHPAAWHAIAMFALSATSEYCDLISAKNPAALVILAHWSLLLDRLPEHHWFVAGQSAYLVEVIRTLLDDEYALLLPHVK